MVATLVALGTETPETLGRLEAWLAERGIGAGDRLPAERTLSEALGVTRSELRKALAVLEARGALRRRVGHGTYLSGVRDGQPARPEVAGLVQRTSPHDAMMARLALEPELAGLAAIHATPAQLAEIRRLAAAIRTAPSWADYERLDAEFHQAIAEAGRNALLAELYRILNAVRVSVVWPRLDVPDAAPPPGYHSFAEHDAILDALDRRDRAGAARAMRAHLRSTRETLAPDD